MANKPTRLTRTESQASWLEALERGEADIEAGLIVPLEPILHELHASFARMEAKQVGTTKR